jgi:hypothetical protein
MLQGILDEELAGVDKKAKDIEAAGIVMPPPPPEELDDVCMSVNLPFFLAVSYRLLREFLHFICDLV